MARRTSCRSRSAAVQIPALATALACTKNIKDKFSERSLISPANTRHLQINHGRHLTYPLYFLRQVSPSLSSFYRSKLHRSFSHIIFKRPKEKAQQK
jgi:hypothetical protein